MVTSAPPSEAGPPRVLAASGSEDWIQRVCEALAEAPLHVLPLRTGKEVRSALAEDHGASLVILDAQVGDMTGLALCRSLRESESAARVPILFVSGLAGEVDRVLAFETGADDFLADPFFGRELLSRVQAVLRRDGRRGRSRSDAAKVRLGELNVDLRRGRVEVEGRPVELTARELDILRVLIHHEGRVVRREELLETLEGTDARTVRVVDTHVKAIRRKLGPARDCVQTVRGVGYRFHLDG